MKIALRVATVLSWFNIIFWGMIVVLGLLGSVVVGQMPLVVSLVLLSAIPLNSFAALRLHSSIRYTGVPLNHQTPVGIRFVGLIALFFGFLLIFLGFSILGNPGAMMDSMKAAISQMPEDTRGMYTFLLNKVFVLLLGVAFLFLGLSDAINVVLNLRLLRWYYLVHKRDVS
ncbi:MAG TPA: hypothetical protein VG101_21235 [Puia sp.]|jgi:hypothetical protein|nr:hypothetical protein [Puia sp.]